LSPADDRPNPEFVGKKIAATEVKLTMIALPCVPLAISGWRRQRVCRPRLGDPGHSGPHGFSEVLYAFTSRATNGERLRGSQREYAVYN
jgi:K+-transporting ATPase ATPase A chain